MAKIYVTKDEPDPASATEYVQVRCWRVDDGDVLGDWMRVALNGNSRVTVHVSKHPLPIADAWEEAKAYAATYDLTWFRLIDEHNVFPATKLGLAPLLPGAS